MQNAIPTNYQPKTLGSLFCAIGMNEIVIEDPMCSGVYKGKKFYGYIWGDSNFMIMQPGGCALCLSLPEVHKYVTTGKQ